MDEITDTELLQQERNQIVFAFVLIYYLFIKMHMFEKERRRIELLLPCFNVADYSIDIIRSEDDVLKKIETEESIRIKKRVHEILNTIDDPSDLLLRDSEIEPIQSIINRIKNETPRNVKPDKPFSIFHPSTWRLPWGKKNNSESAKISNEKQQLINDLDIINHLLLKIKSVKEEKFFKIIEQKKKESFTGDNISKTDFCQQILRELGQEVLAKRINWLLDVDDRNIQKPK